MYYTNYSPLGSTPDEIKLGDCVTVLISGPRDLVRWSKSTYMVIDFLNPCKVLLENGMKQDIQKIRLAGRLKYTTYGVLKYIRV